MNQTNSQKKIVMLVVNDFTHDARVLKEAQSARDAGFAVTVIGRKSKETPFFEEKDGIKIIRVQTFFDKFWSKISKSGGTEVAGSQSAGAPKALVTYAAILNTAAINRLFAKETLKIKPDLIHANDTTALAAAYQIKRAGIPIVYDAHELYTEQLTNPNPVWKRYFTNLEKKLNQVDGIFSVNQSILNELEKRYELKDIPQAILYNTPYYLKTADIKPNKEIKLLYLGHYMSGRGIEELVAAVNNLEDVTLTAYGKGFPDLGDKVKICQPVPPEKVVSEAQKYDIGILPYIGNSLNNLYSTPNKLFEYMMAGLAIAASQLPEIKRIVEAEQCGVLFDPTDPKSMVKAIESLARNRENLAKCRENSLRAAKEYCWENQAKKQLAMYRQVIPN